MHLHLGQFHCLLHFSPNGQKIVGIETQNQSNINMITEDKVLKIKSLLSNQMTMLLNWDRKETWQVFKS